MRPIIIGGGSDANTLLLCKFDEWVDSSVYQRLITPSVPASLTDSAGGAPVATGFGQYAYMPGNSTLTAGYFSATTDATADAVFNLSWTIEAWIKRVGVSSTNATAQFFSKRELVLPALSPISIGILGTTNQIQFTYRTGSGLTGSNFGSVDADWHHHAVTKVGSEVKYYLDGTLIQTIALSDVLIENAFPLQIGTRVDAVGNIFGANCYMDDVRLSQVVRYDSDFTPPGPHKR